MVRSSFRKARRVCSICTHLLSRCKKSEHLIYSFFHRASQLCNKLFADIVFSLHLFQFRLNHGGQRRKREKRMWQRGAIELTWEGDEYGNIFRLGSFHFFTSNLSGNISLNICRVHVSTILFNCFEIIKFKLLFDA